MPTPVPRNPWAVVAGSMIGLTVGNGPVVLFTFGILLGPITAEFGWTRATVGAAIAFAHVTAAIATPIIGKLIDRFGIRAVTLPCIVLFALTTALIGLTPASPAIFVALYALCGVFSAGQTPMPYAKAVAACFDARRGLALGVAMTGVGIGTSLVPQVTRLFVNQIGWRGAYAGLGVLILLLALPAVGFLLTGADEILAAARSRSANDAPIPGLSLKVVARTARFWAIAIAAFLLATAVNGTIAHFVPLLKDRGMPASEAETLIAAVGISTIAGRVISGFLLDRFFAPYVASGFFCLPLTGVLLLLTGAGGAAPLIAIIFLGLGLGAEIDMIGFLISRYFGIRTFGEIYGYVFALFALGSGVGPYLMGLSFDMTHSYAVSLMSAAAAIVVSVLCVYGLGPYLYPAPAHTDLDSTARQPAN